MKIIIISFVFTGNKEEEMCITCVYLAVQSGVVVGLVIVVCQNFNSRI